MSKVTLFLNATVLTMDAAHPSAEAFAVRGEHIVAVGRAEAIQRFRERDSEVIDLGGRTVLPGFVDPHNHFSIGALECFWADCRGTRSVEDIHDRIAEAAHRTPDGLWVPGVGYNHA